MSVPNTIQDGIDDLGRDIQPEDWAHLPTGTDHAKLRWLQRGTAHSLTEAWLHGYYVGGISYDGTSKLHPPSRTIIVVRDNKIITVLCSEYTSYNSDHLVVCDTCNLEYKPSKDDRSCPWCEDGQKREGEF